MRGYNNAQFLLLPRKVARNAANVVSFSMLYFSPSDSAVKPVKKSVVKSTTQFAWVQRILVAVLLVLSFFIVLMVCVRRYVNGSTSSLKDSEF